MLASGAANGSTSRQESGEEADDSLLPVFLLHGCRVGGWVKWSREVITCDSSNDKHFLIGLLKKLYWFSLDFQEAFLHEAWRWWRTLLISSLTSLAFSSAFAHCNSPGANPPRDCRSGGHAQVRKQMRNFFFFCESDFETLKGKCQIDSQLCEWWLYWMRVRFVPNDIYLLSKI